MKPGYAALIPLVHTATELPFAECFTLTLLDGTQLRYTNLDVPVWLNGIYFAANAVRISGLKFKQTTGVDIDEQQIDLICSGIDTIKGVPVIQAIRNHVLDGCYIQRDRAFFDPAVAWPPKPLVGAVATGGVTLFRGRVAAITALGRTMASINVKSDMVLLDIDFPRNLWQASCLHTLYDAGCGLSRGDYQGFGTVGAGATSTTLPVATGGSGASLVVSTAGVVGSPILRVAVTSPDSINNQYVSAPVVSIADPTGTGCVLRGLMAPTYRGRSGALVYRFYGVQVVNPGSGYTNPVVTIGPGSAGTATALAVLAGGGGSVTSVAVVAGGGGGYSAGAQVVISGGGGQGALAVPVISGGVVTGVTMVDGGSGYISAPVAMMVDNPFANYSQGSLMFQGGLNTGVLVQIKSATATMLTLAAPLIYQPAAGDVFSIWPGCDHTQGAGGCKKFNNLKNFRGFPYVPPPETAY